MTANDDHPDKSISAPEQLTQSMKKTDRTVKYGRPSQVAGEQIEAHVS